MTGTESKLQEAMRKIAQNAADQIKSGFLIGLGSGSAVAVFAKVLGEKVSSGELEGISIVPSSMQAWLMAKDNGLNLHQDSAHCPATLDVAVDGADQVSQKSRSMIKGGGGALLREKIILNASKKSFILIDSSKLAPKLSRAVPIELIQFAVDSAKKSINHAVPCDPSLRMLDKGYPFFTESGNVILDVQTKQPIEDPKTMESILKSIPGVVEVGIFNCPIEKFYVAKPDGSTDSI